MTDPSPPICRIDVFPAESWMTGKFRAILVGTSHCGGGDTIASAVTDLFDRMMATAIENAIQVHGAMGKAGR